MSAELLRRAATQMREKATAVPPGPWFANADDLIGGFCVGVENKPASSVTGEWVGSFMDAHRAEHVASWHPVVALAVADWLEREAADVEAGDAVLGPYPLAVATAYLGES